MKRLVVILAFVVLLTITGYGGTRLRFVNAAGRPIPDVTVKVSFTYSPPAPPGPPGGIIESDIGGLVTINHPCGITTGSCCMLVQGSYSISKPGLRFSQTGGTVTCSLGSPQLVVTGSELPDIASVSAASYRLLLTNEMITALFGINLASATEIATLPLKTALGGRSLLIRDSNGMEKAALLLLVSPGQINCVMPGGLADGPVAMMLKDESGNAINVGFSAISKISPGVFTANSDGQGAPAAIITRVKPDNSQTYELVAQLDEAQGRFVPVALDLGLESEFVVLSLFGTGWRQFGSIADVKVTIGGVDCPVEYAGKQPTIEGLDQINARLPRTMIGKGDVTVEVKFGSTFANPTQLKFK